MRERENEELKATLAKTECPSIEIARMEYEFAEHRYQEESNHIEKRRSLETERQDILTKLLQDNRQLLKQIYEQDQEPEDTEKPRILTSHDSPCLCLFSKN